MEESLTESGRLLSVSVTDSLTDAASMVVRNEIPLTSDRDTFSATVDESNIEKVLVTTSLMITLSVTVELLKTLNCGVVCSVMDSETVTELLVLRDVIVFSVTLSVTVAVLLTLT